MQESHHLPKSLDLSTRHLLSVSPSELFARAGTESICGGLSPVGISTRFSANIVEYLVQVHHEVHKIQIQGLTHTKKVKITNKKSCFF